LSVVPSSEVISRRAGSTVSRLKKVSTPMPRSSRIGATNSATLSMVKARPSGKV